MCIRDSSDSSLGNTGMMIPNPITSSKRVAKIKPMAASFFIINDVIRANVSILHQKTNLIRNQVGRNHLKFIFLYFEDVLNLQFLSVFS